MCTWVKLGSSRTNRSTFAADIRNQFYSYQVTVGASVIWHVSVFMSGVLRPSSTYTLCLGEVIEISVNSGSGCADCEFPMMPTALF